MSSICLYPNKAIDYTISNSTDWLSSVDHIDLEQNEWSIIQDNLKYKFNLFFEKWKTETAFYSSITDICENYYYQEIIKMGKNVIPLILNKLKEEPDLWFWALKVISKKDPVPKDHRGNIKAMTSDWIEWGIKKGYLD